MITSPKAITFDLKPVDNHRLASLCGELNTNLKKIQQTLDVRISNRGHHFKITGKSKGVTRAKKVLHRLYESAAQEIDLSPEQIHLALCHDEEQGAVIAPSMGVQIKGQRILVKGQNKNQRGYLQSIIDHDINFAVGPAGTGKTFLAVASATQALLQDQVNRIILVRPAVEAGERLGFLPGDIGQKVDPYLRPLYDALYEMLGFEKVAQLLDRNIIELAPLAYMRGRTLNESFVILDEAQNTTVEQMKMFLTRVGFGTKTVVTGDITQIDLPRGVTSGLKHALGVLNHINGISITRFQPQDVVRHPLVQRVVEAYEAASGSEDELS